MFARFVWEYKVQNHWTGGPNKGYFSLCTVSVPSIIDGIRTRVTPIKATTESVRQTAWKFGHS